VTMVASATTTRCGWKAGVSRHDPRGTVPLRSGRCSVGLEAPCGADRRQLCLAKYQQIAAQIGRLWREQRERDERDRGRPKGRNPGERRGRPGRDPLLLARVAEYYASYDGVGVWAALAKKFGFPESQARGWIHAARVRRPPFLTYTARGQRGGDLTEDAKKVLRVDVT
jgi:hypothetical protein